MGRALETTCSNRAENSRLDTRRTTFVLLESRLTAAHHTLAKKPLTSREYEVVPRFIAFLEKNIVLATLALLSAVTVSTKAQLDAALQRARGGDVIQLARGQYGDLVLNGRQFDRVVTLQSANPLTPASFSTVKLLKVNNVALKNLEITRARGKDPYYTKMVQVSDSTNVSLTGGFVHGTANGSWVDDMSGMYVRNSKNIRINGVSFHDLAIALIVEDSSNFRIENNFFSYISVDSMEIPGTRDGVITENSMFLFNPAPTAHPDGIQCWTAGKTTGCKNITISYNKFFGAPGREFQGVFFGDEANVGGYDNIQIVGNVMSSLMWHAISVAGVDKALTIRNNTITAGPTYRSWIRTSGPATLSGNVAPTYSIAGKSGVPAGNR